MRFPRIKPEGQSFFHCISRIVEGRFIFGSTRPCSKAEKFITIMRRLEAFSGVRILAYVMMGDHFHLLCEVPEARVLSQNELERIEALRPLNLSRCWKTIGPLHSTTCALSRAPFCWALRRRMNDLSISIKELKGRFAQWYNRRHGRNGTLWAERFKSVLFEGGQAVATTAAYIDLNPVRAALCEDPKDIVTAVMRRPLAKGSAVAHEVSGPFWACRRLPTRSTSTGVSQAPVF